MTPLYAFSLLPVIAVAFLLFFTAALRGRNARGLALFCLSVAVWSSGLLLLAFPRTSPLGQRLAALGTFIAAGYLHAAFDLTKQRSYALVYFAYAAAASLSLLGFLWPTQLHQPGGLGQGPLFWPVMALAVAAATVPLWQLARAFRAAGPEQRAELGLTLLAGALAYVGALGNALLLAYGIALPFGMTLVLGGLLTLGAVIRAHEPLAERRLLDRSLRYSALAAFTYGALFFGVLAAMPEGPLFGSYRAGALLLFCMAALALEPVRQLLLEVLGRKLWHGHAGASDLARALVAQEARADHSARLAELGTFVSAVAHEVRNPLGVLSANLSLLERQGADSETTQAMREQIERASHFLAELLSYGRPRPLELRELDLEALIDLALSSARQALGGEAPALEPERKRGAKSPSFGVHGLLPRLLPGLLIEGDQAQLLQVLIVLFENGLLALAGVASPRLQVQSELVGGEVRVVVEDNGPGIDPDLLPRLFQPFVTGRKREGPRRGTGLGLAIARGIVERHGGRIEVGRSPELGGARFSLQLPRRQQAPGTAAGEGGP